MADKRVSTSKRREHRPFLEKHGRQHKWRRIVPPDIQKALGLDAWVYVFPPGTADAVLDATSLALAAQTDELIETTRAKLKTLAEAREQRQSQAVVRP